MLSSERKGECYYCNGQQGKSGNKSAYVCQFLNNHDALRDKIHRMPTRALLKL